MKKKSVAKRFGAALLAALLALACASCSPADSGSSPAGAEGSKADAGGESTPADDGGSDGDVVTLKMFVEPTWWDYHDWSGRIPEIATEKTGVDFEVTVAADANALNMMIASGDMGDIVVAESIARMNDGNICYDLDSLAEQYNMDLSSIGEVMRFINTADDGKLYSILVGFSPDKVMEEYEAVLEGEGLVCRTDILEELNVKETDINSLADFEELLGKVKENYPDLVPVIWSSINECRVPNILFGARRENDGFIVQDGQLYTFIEDPKMKDVYMTLNRWYRNGYITAENFSFSTGSEALEYFVSGKAFANIAYGSTAENWNETEFPKAGVDFTVTQMVSIFNDPNAEFIQRNPGWRGLYIPKSCSDPEAALRFCLWAWSDEGRHTLLWGEEGVDWNWSEDHTYPELNYNFENPNVEDGMKYWGWTCHNGYDNTAPQKSSAGSTLDAYTKLTSILRMDPIVGGLRVPPDSDESVIMNNLEDLEKNERVNIVTAATEEEALAAYDNMIAMAKEMGSDKLVEWAMPKWQERQAAYDEIKDSPN